MICLLIVLASIATYVAIGLVVARIVFLVVRDKDPSFTALATIFWPFVVVVGPFIWLIVRFAPAAHRWVTRQPGRGKR